MSCSLGGDAIPRMGYRPPTTSMTDAIHGATLGAVQAREEQADSSMRGAEHAGLARKSECRFGYGFIFPVEKYLVVSDKVRSPCGFFTLSNDLAP